MRKQKIDINPGWDFFWDGRYRKEGHTHWRLEKSTENKSTVTVRSWPDEDPVVTVK